MDSATHYAEQHSPALLRLATDDHLKKFLEPLVLAVVKQLLAAWLGTHIMLVCLSLSFAAHATNEPCVSNQ